MTLTANEEAFDKKQLEEKLQKFLQQGEDFLKRRKEWEKK
jgi:hypothetical protein